MTANIHPSRQSFQALHEYMKTHGASAEELNYFMERVEQAVAVEGESADWTRFHSLDFDCKQLIEIACNYLIQPIGLDSRGHIYVTKDNALAIQKRQIQRLTEKVQSYENIPYTVGLFGVCMFMGWCSLKYT